MTRKTILWAALLSALIAAPAAQADINKGQKAYLKSCKKCHGNGTKGAAMKTQDAWEELFDDNAALLIEAHKGDKSEKFFAGEKFKKLSSDLKDFLYEYAADSGNVPSCG